MAPWKLSDAKHQGTVKQGCFRLEGRCPAQAGLICLGMAVLQHQVQLGAILSLKDQLVSTLMAL